MEDGLLGNDVKRGQLLSSRSWFSRFSLCSSPLERVDKKLPQHPHHRQQYTGTMDLQLCQIKKWPDTVAALFWSCVLEVKTSVMAAKHMKHIHSKKRRMSEMMALMLLMPFWLQSGT
eukprot:4546454-Ditylum_brightwellii.AAC.1